MKKTILLIVFSIGYYGYSQIKTTDKVSVRVSYQMIYKKFITSVELLNVKTILVVNSQGSLFTSESMMKFEEIQKVRVLTDADVLSNSLSFHYLIKSKGENIEHFEDIGNNSYKFEEKIYHDWKLVNQDSLISGYTCKKAILQYAGREWIAWYATKIPISSGPYKFNGLPGLILNIRDLENVFSFVASDIKTGDFNIDPIVENYFIKEESKPFESINPQEFYQIRIKFYQMSLNEKLQYMNSENGAKPTFLIEGANGERARVNAKSKKRNFIER